ncbi:uncharacterized protein LOC142336053 [Convolutriloba macropyga]|uniref:uncharacterized protein LOC142336053 n=1 Tax=Convolutriloba macropyga TaxID=536237 RepID=UPI003F52785F
MFDVCNVFSDNLNSDFQKLMFSFGAKSAASTTPNTGGLFGTLAKPQTSATTGFSFNPTTSTSSQTGTGLSFNFGPTATTSASGGLFLTQPATSSSGTGLFGTLNPAKSSAPSLFGGFSATTSTAGTGGLFGAKPAGSGTLFGPTPASQTTSAPQFKGLGGTDSVSTTAGQNAQNAGSASQQPKLAKESNVPPELLQHVDALKKHIVEEKKYRDEISKNSTAKPLFEIQSEVSNLRNETVMAFSLVQKSLNHAKSIKEEFNRELKNFEMISRVRDTPIALQDAYHNPIVYFQEKTNFFLQQMVNLSDQLQLVERFFAERHGTVTTEDFVAGLQQINDVFVGLVGKYQMLQERMEQLKAEYLHYKKTTQQDSTDVFKKLQKDSLNLNLASLSPSKYPDVKSMEKRVEFRDISNTNSAVTCTIGPNCFTVSSTTDSNAVIGKAGLFAGAGNTTGSGLSSSGFGTSLFGTPNQSTLGGGLFGTQSSGLGVTFGGTSPATPASKPGTKRNKSK